ncbi:cell division protein SepF [Inconstantimicrobium porci]|uniref:Cell division protein SepF n=1 Tax=Inconstantimicrobium porci TaxID=2652291 RepID=A0A7X2T0B9_9CLOT|nr:cell division protein SepF [Inconstantimicrobium porci]MSR90015.1 DUF552 domain-containing protein [Inconstantimicrobium porci]
MSNVFNKLGKIIGFDYEDEDFEDDELLEEQEEENVVETPFIRKNNKVVNIHTAISAKVMITKPTCIEDASEISDAVKNRKIVVVNTTALDKQVAQRVLDSISGACYVLDATLQEVEKGVYLLSPSNVEVTNELKSELSNKGLFNWSK